MVKDIPCGWGTLGPFSCRHRGPALPRQAGPPGRARGEDLSQKSSGKASSHCSTSDPQHSFTYHGLFLFFPQNILQKKIEKGWRKTHVWCLPVHLSQLPLCMTQSSRIRQFHLVLIYMFSPSHIPARAVFSRACSHHHLCWGVFALSHVLTFSHVAFKLQHWFQLSLVCKRINSANTFQILSQCKTNIALEKSNYGADSGSAKHLQRFLLISQLSLISQNSLTSYFYQDIKEPLSRWTLKSL